MDFRSFRISVSKLSSRATSPALSLALFVVILGATSGCNNEPMTAPSEVIRNRVAAIRAEPPEISLGESTTLSALLVHPDPIPPALGQVWFACLETSSATGCLDMDFSSLGEGTEGDGDGDGDEESPPLQFGLGPSFEYRAEGSDVETAWEALEAEERIEGLTVLVSVAYVEATNEELLALFATFATGSDEDIAEAQQEIESLMSGAILAARRIVISDKNGGQPDSIACEVNELIPNINPSLERLRGHLDNKGRDSGVELDDVTLVEPGEALVLRPQLDEGSAEPYLFINRNGETECRKEAPYFAWLSNGGNHIGDYSFTADLEDLDETPGRPKVHSFILPGEDEFTRPIDLWVVVRDRRGGVDWRSWSFSPAP
jgi:hypothetical protein